MEVIRKNTYGYIHSNKSMKEQRDNSEINCNQVLLHMSHPFIPMLSITCIFVTVEDETDYILLYIDIIVEEC